MSRAYYYRQYKRLELNTAICIFSALATGWALAIRVYVRKS